MNTVNILALNVGRLCDERGWSKKKLAKETGMMEAALSRALSGNPQLKTIEKIAKALNVPITVLFEDKDAVDGYIHIYGKTYRVLSKEGLVSLLNGNK